MKRGEIWTQAGGPGYAGKPRPALIVQADLLAGTDSIVTCLFTSYGNEELPTRLRFTPTVGNGLNEPCDLMADKIMAVPRSKLGRRIGEATAEDMERIEQALIIVLGFAR